MAENPRKFMFNVKYRTFMMEVEDGEFIAEVLPEEIKRGDGFQLNLLEYEIKVKNLHEAVINQVYNRKFGPVKYHAHAIDQECGLVLGSTIHIYTCEQTKSILNIIHCHINDMSDSVTLEVEYMGDGELVSAYHEFKKDFAGLTLRYKVLVRDHKIYRVLYNQGEGVISEI